MLRFQSHPDKVFTAILTDSIVLMINEINDSVVLSQSKEEQSEYLKSFLPNASKVFDPQTALNTLHEMMVCLQRPPLYQLNDYHYLLLYDTLSNLFDLHNDAVREAKTKQHRKQISQIGAYYIEELLFNDMVDIYFFDTDFLFDPETMMQLGLEGKKAMAINEETFGLTQGLTPHPEELELKVHESETPIEVDPSPYFGTKSKVYPDFDYKERSE
jgi:hypothetical protein